LASKDFLSSFLAAFGRFAQPVLDALNSEAEFASFIAELGWTLDPTATLAQLTPKFQGVTLAGTTLVNDATSGKDSSTLESDVVGLVEAMVALAATNPAGLPAPLDKQAFWTALPDDLLELLVYKYLAGNHRLLFGALAFVGVLSEKPDQTAGRAPYPRKTVDWSRLTSALTKPDHMLADVYGWGASFDHVSFITNIGALLSGFRLSADVSSAESSLADLYYDGTNPVRDSLNRLLLSPFQVSTSNTIASGFIKPFVVVLPIPPDSDPASAPVGIVVFPAVTGHADVSIPLTTGVDMRIDGDFQASIVRVEVRPTGTKLALFTAPVKIAAKVALHAQRQAGWTVVGDPAATGLRIYEGHAGLGANGPPDKFEYTVDGGIDHAEIVLDFSKSDGFLSTIMGPTRQVIGFGFGVAWSSSHGFAFQGQAMLEANLPVHLDLAGILTIDKVYLALKADLQAQVLKAEAAVSGGLALGPVVAEVDRVGLSVALKPTDKSSPGNLGTATFAFGFKPPNGIGLAIDAGVVVGGGYIFCNPDKGEYAGVLELSVEAVQVKIIGILNTILPGGQSGFSLLLIVSADFEPIQLAFGFTLNGVGGLAGINRTMVLDALRTGLKHHTLNSILFPKEPIKHAQQIISDLQTVFPPQQNRYVFGPMVELGWGVPSLIIAELGIVLELPAPIRLAILGQMTAAIPEKKAAVVLIHLDVLGTIEFEKKFLAIDATLYDSRVTTFTLLGDMALRMLWGDNANFALSVGGLHPKYQPPPAFPSLTRLTLSMGKGDNPRLSCNAYFAVTSNTLQFGAGMSLYASAAGFTLEGHLGFDALFVFSPAFHFSVEISGSVDLKQNNSTLMSLNLDLLLDGPNPFHASGSVSVHILFFTVSVGFDATWGDATQVSLPAQDPTPKLLEALNDPRSWNASMPPDAERAASLVAPAPDNTTVVIHPLSDLGVTQKILPLGFRMTRFGSASPIVADQFDVKDVALNGQSVPKAGISMVPQNFAPGQFQDLSEDAKLSRPSFEPHPGGVQLTSSAVATGTVTTLDVEYETILVDDPLLPGTSVGTSGVDSTVFLAQAGQGAAQFSELRNSGKRKFLDPAAPDGTVRLGHVTYTVTSKKDLSVRADISGNGSFASVQQSVDAYVSRNPAEREDLQVTPSHQTVRV
jgi:hypothetical protein